jgi:hypothetical protein
MKLEEYPFIPHREPEGSPPEEHNCMYGEMYKSPACTKPGKGVWMIWRRAGREQPVYLCAEHARCVFRGKPSKGESQ